jgi:hypothetical protein
MTRTGAAAIAYARSRVGGVTPEGSGYCLAFTRQCFAVPAYYASAIDAAHGADYPHPGDRNIPPASPVFFSSSSVYDHVAFYVSDSEVITTWTDDIYSWSMDRMIRDYGIYRGWSEDLNKVYVMASTTPPPLPEEEDKMLGLARLKDDPQVWIGDGVTRRRVRSENELADLTYKINGGYFKGTSEVQVVLSIDWLGAPVD